MNSVIFIISPRTLLQIDPLCWYFFDLKKIQVFLFSPSKSSAAELHYIFTLFKHRQNIVFLQWLPLVNNSKVYWNLFSSSCSIQSIASTFKWNQLSISTESSQCYTSFLLCDTCCLFMNPSAHASCFHIYSHCESCSSVCYVNSLSNDF